MYALCVEASHARGMGHLYRGLALARALERRGAQTRLFLNDAPEAAAVLRREDRPFTAVDLSSLDVGELVRRHAIRVWIDDRFATDERHARRVLDAGARLATIEDRGSGARLADLHVMPLGQGEGKRVLGGWRYLVLDEDVLRHRRRRAVPGSLVVSMGGADTYGLTVDVVRALRDLGRAATVVLGPGFSHEAALAPLLGGGIEARRGLRSLAEEFARHDVAITAGGVTLFEAAAAGLACIAIAAEPWERESVQALAAQGACRFAGYRADFDRAALGAPLDVARMSEAALAAVDGEGAGRVAEELLGL